MPSRALVDSPGGEGITAEARIAERRAAEVRLVTAITSHTSKDGGSVDAALATRLLAGFRGDLPPREIAPGYKLGLAVVALATL